MKMPILHALAAVALAAALAGCAAVRHQPAELTPAPDAAQKSLASSLDLRLNTGYERTLKAGSRWQRTGRIAQGAVYKPYQDVFTVEGSHIHEAWLVVRDDGMLVGFYLPAERGFSPLDPVVPISLN